MTEEQAFTLMRFQIRALGMSPATEHKPTNAYVYALEEGVYPAFSNGVPWHEPFADQFDISKEQVEELAKFFDDHWVNKTVPTFYELEDHYQVRRGTTSWDRFRLICVCRYMSLQDLFDDEFWARLLTEMEHPSEAASITRPMNRQTDVYFN